MNLGRAAALGAASGLRASLGFGTVLAEHERLRPLARLGVATELVIDKLPRTPSRLEPRGIILRLLSGAAVGASTGGLVGALVATGTAAASARIGHDLRAELSKHAPPFAVAVAEDLVALGLARA